MDELGYLPNGAARALKYGSYGTIGLIAHRLASTGESRTFEAVVEAARLQGYTVSLVEVRTPSSADVTEAAARLSNQAIDGLIIIRAEIETTGALALPQRLPVVVSDSRLHVHLPSVGADQVTGTRLAVEHLLALGHTTVHHMSGPADSSPGQLRASEWRAALRAAGRTTPAPYVGDWSASSGYQLGVHIAADRTITAVFCANDEMAAGLIRAAHERGRDVPRDLSVVGFDDIPLASFLWPPLTTVAQDFTAIGESLVDLLMRQIRNPEEIADVHIVVPVELVVRASTTIPRR